MFCWGWVAQRAADPCHCATAQGAPTAAQHDPLCSGTRSSWRKCGSPGMEFLQRSSLQSNLSFLFEAPQMLEWTVKIRKLSFRKVQRDNNNFNHNVQNGKRINEIRTLLKSIIYISIQEYSTSVDGNVISQPKIISQGYVTETKLKHENG